MWASEKLGNEEPEDWTTYREPDPGWHSSIYTLRLTFYGVGVQEKLPAGTVTYDTYYWAGIVIETIWDISGTGGIPWLIFVMGSEIDVTLAFQVREGKGITVQGWAEDVDWVYIVPLLGWTFYQGTHNSPIATVGSYDVVGD